MTYRYTQVSVLGNLQGRWLLARSEFPSLRGYQP